MEEEGEENGESTYQFLNLVPLPPISIINNDNFSSITTTRYKRIKHPLRRQEGGKRLNGYTRGKNWLFA